MSYSDAYRASAPFAKLVSLSVMMLLGMPYLQTMSATKRTAVGPSSFLIGRASIHLVNLSTTCDQEMCHATSGPLQWAYHVQTPHRKRPCYWDCLQC